MGAMSTPLIIAITGASGAVYGLRALELLKRAEIETHLVMTQTAREILEHETGQPARAAEALATVTYPPEAVGAAIASGSFQTRGMLVAPCSIKTLSAVANAYAHDLVARAADVCLKEGRPLVLMVREAPLHKGHLRLMLEAAEAGAIIFPPVPAFYGKPQTVDEMVTATVGRALARLGIETGAYFQWRGQPPDEA